MKIILNFEFKGDRKYVHGTDIYSEIEQFAAKKELGFISKIRFKNILYNQGRLLIQEKGLDRKQPLSDNLSCCATGELSGGKGYNFSLLPIENSTINTRYKFDESLIRNNTKIDLEKRTVYLKENTGYKLIEEIVALTKTLHNVIIPTKDSQWFFTGLMLKNMLIRKRKDQSLKIKINHIMANTFSKSKVYLGIEEIGSIEFTLGKA